MKGVQCLLNQVVIYLCIDFIWHEMVPATESQLKFVTETKSSKFIWK